MIFLVKQQIMQEYICSQTICKYWMQPSFLQVMNAASSPAVTDLRAKTVGRSEMGDNRPGAQSAEDNSLYAYQPKI